MAELFSIILAWITVVGTYGQITDVITAKIGTDTILPFTFSTVQKQLTCHLFTSFMGCPFALMDNFTSLLPRFTIVRDSKRKWNLLITNVSKEDIGEYLIGCNMLSSRSNVLFLHTIDENSFQYNETVLVEGRAICTLNLVNRNPLDIDITYVIRFNGTIWTALTYHDQFLDLIDQNERIVLNTENLTTKDEGIYHLMDICWRSTCMVASIRLLIKDLQFHNQVHGNNTYGSVGQIITLSCEILGFYDVEALYIETNGQNVAIGNPARLSYSFLAKKDDHLSIYTCKAKIINYPDVIATDTLLIIHYPPSVEVKLSKDKKRLDCLAQGYPANYTYFWTIFFNFSNTIENVTGLSNGTLFLHNATDNLPKNAIYTCYASNGIRDENGRLYHKHKINIPENSLAENVTIFPGSIAFSILILYIIVSHIVCCCCYQRKKKTYNNAISQFNEYDEIGTVNYQFIAIPPLLSQRPMSDDSVSVQFADVRQPVADIELIDPINHSRLINSQRTSYDDNFNVGSQGDSENLPGNELQTTNNNSSDEDIGSIAIEVFENDVISYRSKSSGETSHEEAEGTSNQLLSGHDYEHMYIQALADDEDKHKYSDRLPVYVNSEVRQTLTIKKKEAYINLRVWES